MPEKMPWDDLPDVKAEAGNPWDSLPEVGAETSTPTFEQAGQHVAKRLGLGAGAAGMGGLPPDVRMSGQHVAGVGAAAALTAGLGLPGVAAGTMAALANPWISGAAGGIEGYRKGGMWGAATGAVQGAVTGAVGGQLGKVLRGARALKGAETVAKAAPVIEEAAQVAKAAEGAAKVGAHVPGAEKVIDGINYVWGAKGGWKQAAKAIEEAAPAVEKAAETVSKSVASAAREFAKANSKKMGEKVWMLIEDGKPVKTLTPDQAGAAARKGLETTWVKNTWGST